MPSVVVLKDDEIQSMVAVESGDTATRTDYVLQKDDEPAVPAVAKVRKDAASPTGADKISFMLSDTSLSLTGSGQQGGDVGPGPYQSEIRNFAWRTVNDPFFQRFVIFLIFLNAVTMGIQTCQFVKESEKWTKALVWIDNIFLVGFTIELVLQYVALGFYRFFNDGWLMFDLFIISFSWILIRYPVQVLRSFRILRAFRLISRIRELKDLVRALVNTIPRMFAIFLLLCLVFYVYAVMFTQLYGDLYETGGTSEDYFSSLTKTAFTLTRIMTMDSWTDIVIEVMEVYPWSWIPFFSFVMVSSFIVINLIIAVICDAVAKLQTEALADQLHAEIAGLQISQSNEPSEYQEGGSQAQETKVAKSHAEIQAKLAELSATLQWLVEQERKRRGQVSSTRDL